MKTITTILTVAVFLFILYKKKVKKKKETDSAALSGSGMIASPTPLLSDVSSYPVHMDCGKENTKYEVMVFDLQAFPDNTIFEDHFATKLALKQKEFITKGYPYRFDFITIATSILVLVTYEVI